MQKLQVPLDECTFFIIDFLHHSVCKICFLDSCIFSSPLAMQTSRTKQDAKQEYANEMQTYRASHIDHKALARTRDVKALQRVHNITQKRTQIQNDFMAQALRVQKVLDHCCSIIQKMSPQEHSQFHDQCKDQRCQCYVKFKLGNHVLPDGLCNHPHINTRLSLTR